MRINRIIDRTKAEGPGVRFCIWVQGCPHKCDGCFSIETWDNCGGYELSADEVIRRISNVKKAIRGITLLGGEPFEQVEELTEIARFAKCEGLDVISFTGYTYDELKNNDCKAKLLEYIDLLIDGKYIASLQDFSRPLAGSSNQRFIYLSKAITEEEMNRYKNRFEIRTDDFGRIYFNGMGDIEKLKKYIKILRS